LVERDLAKVEVAGSKPVSRSNFPTRDRSFDRVLTPRLSPTGIHVMNRTPPEDVRRLLRKEVGFGCPVDDCDSPYLTWHHFDPPWAERQHQDPAGIVALCVQHHGEADHGVWTSDQLRAFKDPARNRAADRVGGRFRWKRGRLILLAGGNWWTGCSILLRCGSIPIIWLSRDSDGYELLNLDLFDETGTARLQLRDNDWIVDRDVEDLECAPRKTALLVKTAALGAELSVSFQRADAELVLEKATRIARVGHREMEQRMQQQLATAPPEFRARMLESISSQSAEEMGERSARFLLEGIAVEDSALCVIEGSLRWPVEIALEPTRIVLPRQNVLSGGVAKNAQVGIQIG
jgi:hypothetical protein